MRRTKITVTTGPSCEDPKMLEKLIKAGANVFRMNFSHNTHQWHGTMVKKIRKVSQKLRLHCPILLDTKGPEIRTGDLKKPIELKKNQELILTIDPREYEITGKLTVNYDGFVDDVKVGDEILIDNGLVRVKVLRKRKPDVICKVLEGAKLTSRRAMNLPGKAVSLESITKKDWEDIKFGIELGVDFIALSFVRTAKEVERVKDYLKRKGSRARVIAKIESFEATKHIPSIIEAADGVMVARGDLGAEIPFAEVPRMQREIIDTAGKLQKPVIVATHMLESMLHSPMPTRAEVTDIAQACWQRADSVMLSGETASGEYPLKSVQAMAKVLEETEDDYMKHRSYRDLEVDSDRNEFCEAAAKIAEDLPDIAAMLVITRSGYMATLASSFRPRVPIFAVTNVPQVRRQVQLLWGTTGLCIDFSSTPEKTVERAQKEFLKQFPKWKKQKYLLISDYLVEKEFVPTLQIRTF